MSKKTFMATVIITPFLISLVAGMQVAGIVEANPISHFPPSLPSIQISADGSINPPTDLVKQVGNVYYLTDDIIQKYALAVYCSGIVIDGKDHIIDGGNDGNSGIMLYGVVNVIVKNVKIYNFWASGVTIASSSNCTVTEVNAINDSYAGIYLESSTGNTVSNNQITGNGDGITLHFSGENELFGNNISGNGFVLVAGAGIVLTNSEQNNIHNNNVVGNRYVVRIDHIYTSEISQNTSSSNNRIYLNNFLNNSYPFYFQDTPFANSWDNGVDGNYWSNYKITYANSNGTYSTPYVLDENNVDHYPLTKPVSNLNNPTPSPTQLLIPKVTILSPRNDSFFNVSIEGVSYQLIFETNSTLSWVGYSIGGNGYSIYGKGNGNVTVSENGTWVRDFGSNGYHTLTLYANDTSGNWAAPQTVTYLVNFYPDYPPTPSPSPTLQPTLEPSQTPDKPKVGDFAPVLIIAGIVVVIVAVTAGALFYHKRRKGGT
jgi:parallel beta-helix repeat protein